MTVIIHSHAKERIRERGASEKEVILTVGEGEQFPAKYGRIGFRRNFPFEGRWLGKKYRTKQVKAYAVLEQGQWIVNPEIVRYF